MFGRRSLLWHVPASVDDIFSLSSVGCYGGKDKMPVVSIDDVQKN